MNISECIWTPAWDFEKWIFGTRSRIVPRSTLPCGGTMLVRIARDLNFGVRYPVVMNGQTVTPSVTTVFYTGFLVFRRGNKIAKSDH
jgi:hypothetical protein